MRNYLPFIGSELSSQWHTTKNGPTTPNKFRTGSNKKVWWLCPEGHEWEATIQSRALKGHGCPFCSGRRVSSTNCLKVTHPELVVQWNYQKNESLTPDSITAGSGRKVWWLGSCGHEWLSTISHRIEGKGCPYCAGRLVCKSNSIRTTHPNLANQWHPTRNGRLTPDEVTAGSIRKVWWICSKSHEWESAPNSRTNMKSGCPFCTNQRVNEENCVKDPILLSQWSPKNGSLLPSQVIAGSSRKIWWVCLKGHEWLATPSNRSKHGCPYCTGQKVCSDNCLEVTHPKFAAQWHPTKNGDLTPSNITHGSTKKVWWICSKGHEWVTTPNSRTSGKGHNCSWCNPQGKYAIGTIYVILSKSENLLKIGWTGRYSVMERVKEIERKKGLSFEILGIFRGSKDLETAFHLRFKSSQAGPKYSREYFRSDSKEVVGFLSTLPLYQAETLTSAT